MLDVTKPCPYCDRRMHRESRFANGNPRWPTIDHKMPVSRGGTNHVDNIVWCCAECNNEKADMTAEEYMEFRRVVQAVHGRAARLLAWRRHCAVEFGLDVDAAE